MGSACHVLLVPGTSGASLQWRPSSETALGDTWAGHCFICWSVPPQGLSFRKGMYQLYSASHDRSVKVWNVEENAYVETL